MLRIKLFAALLILFYGCGEKSPVTTGRNEKLMFSSEAYYNHLRTAFVPDNYRILSDSIQYLDTLYYYYLANNFNPVFIKSFEEEGVIFSLLETFKAADKHGLDPEWYHASLIEKEFISAVTGDSVYPARYEHLANTEVLVADALIKYAWHLRYGVVNPKEIYSDSYYLPLPDSALKDLFEPLKQSDIIGYLEKIQPHSKRYTDLQAALKYYKQFEDLEFAPIQIPSLKIEPGNSSPFIIPIRERLIALKFIDTASVKSDSLNIYDSLLVEPVKEFQRLNGLSDDGVIGTATVEKLNTSPDEYILRIKMNLERFRWNDYSDSSRYILINIPDFRLYVIEEGKEQFDIKVCSGKRRSANFRAQMDQYLKTKRSYQKPEDWETPNMTGEISYLILNPTWTVPNSIIKEEIAREVRKDSTYLLRKNFKVYKDGASVDPAGIPSSEFLRNNTSYRVVQDAGPWNALGKIKFMFNNPFRYLSSRYPEQGTVLQSQQGSKSWMCKSRKAAAAG